ncbi:alpha/beta hydrolase [Xylocopilactobacillus apicola]|uniref:Esterase n=1 Tax=Xylocopilactobacillus apicola TaxID=2932184 RepID=A0AAU9DCH5_9LACO|nr:alpha/beta fold hydrolase [Xylocopilactobacillus apicola]BDR59260.1 esterase [Xylocopilactobacillus apicola]
MKQRFLKISALLATLMTLLVLTGCTTKSKAEPAKPASHLSTVATTTMYSKKLGLDWNYDVYLPEGYNPKSNKTYPVLYMMHGLYGNHRNLLERFNSQQILDGIIHRSKNQAIVVFVDGFNSFYIDAKDGQKMESAIMKDLVPTIEKNYKVSKDPAKHAIGGISMGGYGAARLALKYPDQFSKAVLISPSVWQKLPAESPFRQLHAFTDGKKPWSDKVYDQLFPTNYLNSDSKSVKFFVESTSSDTTVPIKDVDKFVADLKDKGVDVKFVKDSGDNHNWTYWAKAAPNAYSWALKEMN